MDWVRVNSQFGFFCTFCRTFYAVPICETEMFTCFQVIIKRHYSRVILCEDTIWGVAGYTIFIYYIIVGLTRVSSMVYYTSCHSQI